MRRLLLVCAFFLCTGCAAASADTTEVADMLPYLHESNTVLQETNTAAATTYGLDTYLTSAAYRDAVNTSLPAAATAADLYPVCVNNDEPVCVDYNNALTTQTQLTATRHLLTLIAARCNNIASPAVMNGWAPAEVNTLVDSMMNTTNCP